MKNIVAVVGGGFSSEYQISVQSAQEIANKIDKEKNIVFLVRITKKNWDVILENEVIPINKADFSFLYKNEKVVFNCVFIAIHGNPGENGVLQSYFDLLELPYTSCNAFVSALTFNKFYCNSVLKSFHINIAKSVVLHKPTDLSVSEIINAVGLPCFVKPNEGGSSFGTSKVKQQEELSEAIQKAFDEGDSVIIEQFISGVEVTCGIFKSKNETIIFPLTEIVSKNEFFDFEAKYTPEKVEEITPARISKEDTEKCQKYASYIYDILNCSGLVRMDFIFSDNNFWFLEVNTVPGMTKASIIPKQAAIYGLSISELYQKMIDEALLVFQKKENC